MKPGILAAGRPPGEPEPEQLLNPCGIIAAGHGPLHTTEPGTRCRAQVLPC